MSTTTLEIRIWRDSETTEADGDRAVEVLEEILAPQVTATVEVYSEGILDLPDAPYESYREYLDAFAEQASLKSGAISVCLYHYSLMDAADELFDEALDVLDDMGIISCSPTPGEEETIDAAPYLGYDKGWLGPERTPHAVVNTFPRSADLLDAAVDTDTFFDNMVMHEVLHAVLDRANAPDEATDHSFGTTQDGTISPMLTAYAEQFSINTPPERACGQDGVAQTLNHTTSLSECTTQEVERYMAEHFGDDTQ